MTGHKLILFGAVLVAAWTCAPTGALAVTPPQIHTVAGGGSCDPSVAAAAFGGKCDNVSATSVAIAQAGDVAAVPGGGFLYVDSDPGYNLVRAVSSSGKVTTVAGMPPAPNGGPNADGPNGTPAVDSWVGGPVAVAPLPNGSFLIVEKTSSVVRLVSPGPPGVATITTIAGTGTPGNQGTNGGPATSMQLNNPADAEPLPDGRVLIADAGNNRILLLSAAAPGATVTTIAGGGSCDDVATSCDGMPAGSVKLGDPVSVSPIQGGAGGYLIAEDDGTSGHGANAIREVSQLSPSGTFTTVAGTPGQHGYSGDGGPAVFAQLNNPARVLSTSNGGFLIADTDNNRVRSVSPAGTITTIAGNGLSTYAGDGGAATAASTFGPAGVSPTTGGGLLIADKSDAAIREITIPPTTKITLSSPTGANGWYTGPAHATVTGPSGSATACDLDLTAAPTVFDELDTPCAFSGAGADITGDGVHVLWAASMNSFGDKEAPISATVDIDTTPPSMGCVGTPSFVVGARDTLVTATVGDSISGPQQPLVSAGTNTGKLGTHTATLVGANKAGLSARVDCRYTVTPTTLKPTPRLRWSFSRRGGTGTGIRRLVVSSVPARAVVNLACHGKGCPFTSARNVTGKMCSRKPCRAKSPARRPHKVNLVALFSHARLAAGTRLTVSVTKANAIGRIWLFKLRAGKAVSHRTNCLRPGSSVPGRGCHL